ncbi:MAG: hypothetical protein LBJ02_08185 [Bifidobacteriaceae bacterium]|jgi:hypothetical protein|nr:hypothetical protein [Bifidobacteriaceae bacterium]
MRSYNRYSRLIAVVCAVSLCASLALGVLSTDLSEKRFGMLYLCGMSGAIVALVVAAAVRRSRMVVVWPAHLVASWGSAAAAGPGVVGGFAAVLAIATTVVSLLVAMVVCVLHHEVVQNRPVSRL